MEKKKEKKTTGEFTYNWRSHLQHIRKAKAKNSIYFIYSMNIREDIIIIIFTIIIFTIIIFIIFIISHKIMRRCGRAVVCLQKYSENVEQINHGESVRRPRGGSTTYLPTVTLRLMGPP